MKISLLGAPGSGKGTQAKLISDYYGIAHISTGDLFRRAISQNTKLGQEIKKYMSKLVPDRIVIDLVMERIKSDDCKNGFILDGFPRTINQAKMFLKVCKLDHVLYFNIDKDIVINRIRNRITCADCGAIYSKLTYSQDVCSICGGKLTQRAEDQNIEERMDTYQSQTYPLVEYFDKLGLLRTIDGTEVHQTDPKECIQLTFDKVKEYIGDK